MRRTNIFEEVERKNEEDRTKTHQYAPLAIGAFAALATVTIVIITQKLDNFIVTGLLILMLFVLILGFWGKSAYQILKDYAEKRRYDKLAKSYFEGDLTAKWHSNIQTNDYEGYKKYPPILSDYWCGTIKNSRVV